MTVAAGFLGEEGIVLAADSLYTTGSIKVYGQKIFNLEKRGEMAVSLAGAGDVDFLKAVVGDIDAHLPDSATLGQARSIIQARNAKFQKDYVLSHPAVRPEDRPDYSLLIAISSPPEIELLLTTRDAVRPVDYYELMGFGYPIAEAFCHGIYAKKMGIEELEYLALYAIYQAKKFDPLCGGETQAVTLLRSGDRSVLSGELIKKSEDYFEKTGHLLRQYVLPSPSEADESAIFEDMLADDVKELRKLQAELRKLRG